MSHSPEPQGPSPTVALRTRRDGWTADRQRQFLATLAVARSVTVAAATVGLSVRSAYKLRDHAAATDFRAAWDAALFPPPVALGPSLHEQATATEGVRRSRAGLRRTFGAGLGSGGELTVTRPLPAQALIRLLNRVETRVTNAQKRASL